MTPLRVLEFGGAIAGDIVVIGAAGLLIFGLFVYFFGHGGGARGA